MNIFNAVNFTYRLYKKAYTIISHRRYYIRRDTAINFSRAKNQAPYSNIHLICNEEPALSSVDEVKKIPVRLHINDNGKTRKISNKKKANLIISGRMADVCAEIDRLVALENSMAATPHLH